MKHARLLLSLLVVIIVAAVGFPSASRAGPVNLIPPPGDHVPFPMLVRTLSTGLRIAAIKTPHRGMFAMYTVVGSGARDEVEAGHTGFAHFFEHMMFRGTKKWPPEKRNALLSKLGLDDGGYTTDDFTAYHHQGPVAALPQTLALEADRLQNLSYSEDAFRTEAKAVLGEYNKNASSPDFIGYETLRRVAFEKHTYAHTAMGFLEDIEKMPERYAHSLAFFKRHYTPDNVILVIAGDIDLQSTLDTATPLFQPWTGTKTKLTIPQEHAQTAPREKKVPWPSPILARGHLGWHVPASAANLDATAACMVLDTYLFSRSSDLVRTLVIDEGKVESLGSWYEPSRDPGLFPVNYRLKEGATHAEVIDRIQAAVDAIGTGVVDEARLADVKQHIRYSALMEMTSADNVAGAIAYYAGTTMDPRGMERLLAAITGVEKDALVMLAKAHLRADRRTVVTVSHDDNAGAAGAGKNGGAR